MAKSGWSVQYKWSALLGLWALHGAFSLWQFLASHPSPSIEETLLASALLFWTALNFFLIFSLFRNSAWLVRLLDTLKIPSVKDQIFLVATLIFSLRTCLGIFQSVADHSAIWFVGYINRLSPLLDLAAITSAEVVALILFVAFRDNLTNRTWLKPFLVKLVFILALFGGIAFYMSQTRMGIDVIYKGDWARGLPAVPLLEWQILLACLICGGVILIETRPSLKRIPNPDFWIALAVWGFAATLWLSQPIVTNSAALEPLDPNFEIYPFNDSQTYDEFSQSLLIGNGFDAKIPQRPLYILFLTILHLLVGQSYEKMIVGQTLVFALFPALLYLFGREFFGRPLGLSIALLAILRDINSNLVSPFTGNITYSKLYLSEIPTAMFLILFLWVGIRWIRSGFPAFPGFLMGGILGIAMLIRTQVIVALPVIIFIAVLHQPRKFKTIFRSAILMLAVLLLIAAPWLWRNWRLTGSVIFDSPESQTINLALRYSRLNGIEPQALPLPGETSTEYTERLQRIAREAIWANPTGAAKGIFSSFLNHGVDNLLLFPLQNDIKSLGEIIVPTVAFWEGWEGAPTSSQLALILLYIFLLGLGIAAAWHRNGWIGLLPLALNLVYNLWTSLALLSGQRFLVSMDWSIYMYYMLGLFALLSVFFFALERGRTVIYRWYELSTMPPMAPPNPKSWQYLLAGVLFLGVGISLPLVEKAFPQRYLSLSQPELAQIVSSSPALDSFACAKKIIAGSEVNFLRGRALYPRYYEAGGGEWFTDSFGYKATDRGRLVFTLLNESGGRIVFPLDASPEFFPHTADVTLVYGRDRALWFALVQKDDRQAFYISTDFDNSLCY